MIPMAQKLCKTITQPFNKAHKWNLVRWETRNKSFFFFKNLPLKSNFTHSRDRLWKIEIWETSLIVMHGKDVGVWSFIKSCLNTAHLHSEKFSSTHQMFGHPFNRWCISNMVNTLAVMPLMPLLLSRIWMLDQGLGGWFSCQAAISFLTYPFLGPSTA